MGTETAWAEVVPVDPCVHDIGANFWNNTNPQSLPLPWSAGGCGLDCPFDVVDIFECRVSGIYAPKLLHLQNSGSFTPPGCVLFWGAVQLSPACR